MELDTVDELFSLMTNSYIIINQGKAMAFEWGPATGTISGIVSVIELPDI